MDTVLFMYNLFIIYFIMYNSCTTFRYVQRYGTCTLTICDLWKPVNKVINILPKSDNRTFLANLVFLQYSYVFDISSTYILIDRTITAKSNLLNEILPANVKIGLILHRQPVTELNHFELVLEETNISKLVTFQRL